MAAFLCTTNTTSIKHWKAIIAAMVLGLVSDIYNLVVGDAELAGVYVSVILYSFRSSHFSVFAGTQMQR